MVADISGADLQNREDHPFTLKHFLTLAMCTSVFGTVLYGVFELGWDFSDMAGGFLAMGILGALIMGLEADRATKAFVKGMEGMVVASLVIGFSRAIEIVMSDGQIIDTIIYYASLPLQMLPKYVAVQGMLAFQTVLNILVPSGSGQAALTMPLMTPLADLIGVTRQTAVLAFQFGDGLSNMWIPTHGIMLAGLGLAGVPYQRWLRFVMPLFFQLVLLAAAFLALAVFINYS